MLYHGSGTPGIQTLLPRQSNHDQPYVYFTDSEALATIYAHNVMTPPNGWFTYCWDKDGRLIYEEYFPGQLTEFYAGQQGYLYACDLPLRPMAQMPWVYLSDAAVPVTSCRKIPDLLEELLAWEQRGKLLIRRYETLSAAALDTIRRIVLKEIEKDALREHPEAEYARFIHQHFPELL